MGLTNQQIKDNEAYFLNVINTLADGGVFGWKDLGEVLTKRGEKLLCNKKAYEKAKEIVSKEFLKNHFELK